MGANNSTRRVSFESDQNDNITVVKGIRLSENVINRMKESSDHSKHQPSGAPTPTLSPALRPVPPLFDPITSLPPPPLYVEPVASPSPPPPSATETVAAPPPSPPPPSRDQPTMKPASPAPVSEPMAAPKPSPITRPPAAPAVDEEVLRKKITDELHKSLEEERTKADAELQAWLKAEKAQASAKAHAEAQSQVQDEVSRILSVERALAQQSLQQAVIRERIATEDERLRAQLYAKQLEAKEADLRKQDAFYREQVARLEERSAHFYKVTTENYHKAADQVNAKFKRYEVYPVCADLQGQILACYKENIGKTLHCSNIAALYLQCVNNAKQNKLRTGG
ncbi:MICOS complex subunit MIC19 Coiled-coil-helix-coiled-coil-helix domain-containing protein 3 [Channa argus]|uniref:MICOS complex subunit MIC19 Coiled-coil-helix-coiled-coil-helix domain-containing protein 3 n=1 Tax=Channa argus TaxID=215402 RepID=A0A6G1QRE7_CHAAH|nr:MICOS complex subunit MIC19 Coiled-coil-helix-coiled-coil-helix domain-containing protein 3 [Channa argus]